MRASALLLAVLAAVWAAEIFYFQSWTIFGVRGLLQPAAADLLETRKLLFFLDAAAVGSCLLLLPRPALKLLILGCALFWGAAAEYYEYFGRPLLFQTVLTQSGDLLSMKLPVLDVLNWPLWVALTLSCLLKLRLIDHTEPFRIRLGRLRLAGGLCLLSAYGTALIYDLHRTGSLERDFRKLRVVYSPHDLAGRYGHLFSWANEAIIVSPSSALANAESKRSASARARISGAHLPIELPHNIIVVQVESLDYAIIGYRLSDGRTAAPFLTELFSRSLSFKIRPIHRHSSADADFVFLNRIEPADRVLNYRLAGFEYRDTTPELLQKLGYRTSAVHNFRGELFNRYASYRKMHFDRIAFGRELSRHFELPGDWESLNDGLLFAYALEELQKTEEPLFQFIITFTSHMPFKDTPMHFPALFPGNKNRVERYLSSINYFDRQLKSFVDGLPEGTLITVYGDHESGLKHHYTAGMRQTAGEGEYVPFLMYQKGRELQRLQIGGPPLDAQDGALDLLDAARFFYALLQRSAADGEPAAAVSSTK